MEKNLRTKLFGYNPQHLPSIFGIKFPPDCLSSVQLCLRRNLCNHHKIWFSPQKLWITANTNAKIQCQSFKKYCRHFRHGSVQLKIPSLNKVSKFDMLELMASSFIDNGETLVSRMSRWDFLLEYLGNPSDFDWYMCVLSSFGNVQTAKYSLLLQSGNLILDSATALFPIQHFASITFCTSMYFNVCTWHYFAYCIFFTLYNFTLFQNFVLCFLTVNYAYNPDIRKVFGIKIRLFVFCKIEPITWRRRANN